MTKRRHRHGGGRYSTVTPTPSTTGSGVPTHIPDPRASVRFKVNERVRWANDPKQTGVVVGYGRDDDSVFVRLDNGDVVVMVSGLSLLRRVEVPLPEQDEESRVRTRIKFDGFASPDLPFDRTADASQSIRLPEHTTPEVLPDDTLVEISAEERARIMESIGDAGVRDTIPSPPPKRRK